MLEYNHIQFEKGDRFASLTLQREELNLFSIPMLEEINSVLKELTEAHYGTALVINAEGKVFSGGLDFAEHGPEELEKLIHSYHKMFRLLDRLECPSISMVQGAALGAGCELACFCDIVLASENARFGLPEIKVGLLPPIALADFPRYAPLKQVMELVLLGDTVTAEEARIMGLVNKVYSRLDFEPRCEELIYRLTSNPCAILRLAKRAVRTGLNMKFAEALLESEGIYLREMMLTNEAKEGLAKLMDRGSLQE